MPGLYDRYRAVNSNVIPEYHGSAGSEMIQVGQVLQGRYDQALGLGLGINGQLEGITSLDKDKALADELRSTVQNNLQEISKKGNWEDALPQVTTLGQTFANRFRELTAPMQQYAEWEKTLDDKDKNLTPMQKEVIKKIAMSQYRGLRKEGGKYVGSFNGYNTAKNIDVPKKFDEWAQGLAVQEGGNEMVSGTDGMWIMKNGQKWKRVDPATLQRVFQNGMATDEEFRSYLGMMGDISGYMHSNVSSPDEIADPMMRTDAMNLAKTQGISFNEAVRRLAPEYEMKRIANQGMDYGVTKYKLNSNWSTQDLSANAWAMQNNPNDVGIFADLVVGQGDDLSTKYGTADELVTKISDAHRVLDQTETYIEGQRNRVASMLKKPMGQVTDAEVEDWLTKNDQAEIGRFQQNVQTLAGTKTQIAEMNQVRDAAMDAAVKSKTGGQATFAQLGELAKNKLKDFVSGKGTVELKALQRDRNVSPYNTNEKTETLVLNKDNVNDFEVLDGGNPSVGDGWVILKNKKTGKIRRYDGSFKGLDQVGEVFSGIDWKNSYKEGVNGLRSNTVWMPLYNKTTPDGKQTKSGLYATRVESILSAASAGIKIKDMNNSDLGTEETDNLRTLIAAGKYKLLGLGVDPVTGQRRAQVSVEVDPKEQEYKTVTIAAESNIWDRIAAATEETGLKDLQTNNQASQAAGMKSYQFGRALKTGSSYQQVAGMLPGQSATVANSLGIPQFKLVPNTTGDAANAMSFQLIELDGDGQPTGKKETFNDSFDLGAYLDTLRDKGYKLSKNK